MDGLLGHILLLDHENLYQFTGYITAQASGVVLFLFKIQDCVVWAKLARITMGLTNKIFQHQ